jgi:hypothetical protein
MQTLHQARIAEPQLAARVLTQTFKLDAEGLLWLTDLRGFDAQERTEMSETLRAEGVTLADRSKLRRLTSRAEQLSVPKADRSSFLFVQAGSADTISLERRSVQSSEEDGSSTSVEGMAIAVTALLGILSYIVQARTAASAAAADKEHDRRVSIQSASIKCASLACISATLTGRAAMHRQMDCGYRQEGSASKHRAGQVRLISACPPDRGYKSSTSDRGYNIQDSHPQQVLTGAPSCATGCVSK